jgi:DNA transposition AAA+ family ATPase
MSNTRKTGKATGDSAHPAHSDGNPAPEGGMSRDAINIGQNIFKAAIGAYSRREQDALNWLWGYAFDVLGGSWRALADALGYDRTVIFKVFTGRYEAGLDRFVEAVDNLKRRTAKQHGSLVETVVTQRIVEALDYARDMNAMVAITGTTGRSKSQTALAWARGNNHGAARYVRIPSCCTRRTLVQLLCRRSGIGVNGKKTSDLETRLFKAFDFRNTIIIDEAGHLMPRCGTSTSAIEFLRDLSDICRCGVALIFTDVYLNEMFNGRLADYFEQFRGRIKFAVDIPNQVLKDEIRQVVGSFCSDPSPQLLSLALLAANQRDGRLRTLFEDLDRARAWADEHGRPLSSDDLQMAIDWRQSGGVWPEE